MKKLMKSMSCLLAVVLTLTSIIIPATFASATEYNTNLTADVQTFAWHENPTSSACLLKSTASYSGAYVDVDNVVYTLTVNGNTAEIKGISVPLDMDTVTIPRYMNLYRLVKVGTNAINYKNTVTSPVSNATFEWDFSGEIKDVVKNGEIVGKSGPSVEIHYHTVEITGITKTFAENANTVKNIILPESIATIETSAFANNPYVELVHAPGVLEVEKSGFYNCKSLKSVYLPKIKYVRDSAFYKCISLEKFDFSNILSVEAQAFFDCVSLTNINFPATLQQLGTGAFKQCTGIVSITIPEDISINTIPNDCFNLCTSLKEVAFPSNIITIGTSAFLNCESLKVLDLRKTNISTINSKAFWGCLNLTYIVLPETLITFKVDAFDNCTLLRYVYFMSELTPAQQKTIAASDLARCMITEIDKDGPVFENKETKESINKSLTITAPTTFDIYDVVDVASVSETTGHDVTIKDIKNSTHGYVTYGKSLTINKEGTYKLKATDILGNSTVVTITYKIPVTPPVTPKVVRGDIDNDGAATSADARAALRFSVQLDKPTATQFAIADVDKDGTITAADARTILRLAVGLEK